MDRYTLEQAYTEFIAIGCLGLSPETIRWYRRRLSALVDHLGGDRPIEEITLTDLLRFRAEIEGRKTLYGSEISSRPPVEKSLSPYTISSYIRAIKRFFKWAWEMELIDISPAAKLKPPKLPKLTANGIAEGNLERIIQAAKNGESTMHPERDYALICFLESTGCRRAGAAGLRLGDLNLDDPAPKLRRRVKIHEKGMKSRVVFIDQRCESALKTWLSIRPEIDDDHVFLAQSPGQAWHGIKPSGLSSVLSRYKRRLGLKGPCSPHKWRHRWARKMLQDGMDVAYVSQILGHSDVSVTVGFYGGLAVDELQEMFDRAKESVR